MNDNDELEGLGRRQGALWAIDIIRVTIANGDDLPPGMKAVQVAAFGKAMADLAAAGVDQVGCAIFVKSADDEMARRFDALVKVITP